ncbi:MAG TPA: PRC-barrel domain-containing protein [Dehalococcoidia bacterium]|nr:PRC-barrel domain-containing protein [Dehalococcoidia bacterium]
MQVELGAHVRSSDDHAVGRITWLILDPDTGQVKKAVIQKGFLLVEDIEVPLDAFSQDVEGGVRLRYTADEVHNLSRFDQARYAEPTSTYASAWGWPDTAGLLTPVYPLPGPIVADAADRGRTLEDQANAVIQEGSEVFSRDGEKVGEVHRVRFDPNTGRTLSFVVRSGFLFTHDAELPGDTIASVDDQAVYLSLTKDQVRQHETR